jgi:hypothetical protein
VPGLGSGLDESALAAAARLEDETGSRPDGKPVNCRVQVEVTFSFIRASLQGDTFIKTVPALQTARGIFSLNIDQLCCR